MKHLFLLAALMVVSMFASAQEAENLALNKTVVAGYEAGVNEAATAANDGNLGTRWSSSGATHWSAEAPDAAQDWWYVDLGAEYQVGQIRILFEGACPIDYDLQISKDATAWTTIGTYTEAPKKGNGNADYNVYQFENLDKARYVRIFARNGALGFAYGISIWEFEVYDATSVDTKAPVLNAVTLNKVNELWASVIVDATDENGVIACDVTDAANGIDARCILNDDNTISVLNLTPATTYNLSIAAIDATDNRSEAKTITFTTGALGENLALTKPAYGGFNADNAGAANDNNRESQWSTQGEGSLHCGQEGVTEETSNDWWYVDLGATYKISEVRCLFETACPTNFDLLTSLDATTWTLQKNITENPLTGNTVDKYNIYPLENEPEARYVKLFAREGYANLAYGIHIYDFQVYGEVTDVNALPNTIGNQSVFVQKVLEDGQVYIIRDGVRYTVLGTQVE